MKGRIVCIFVPPWQIRRVQAAGQRMMGLDASSETSLKYSGALEAAISIFTLRPGGVREPRLHLWRFTASPEVFGAERQFPVAIDALQGRASFEFHE